MLARENMVEQFAFLSNDQLRATISAQGGALIDVRRQDGRPVLRPRAHSAEFDIADAACFPLVPLGNRVEGNAFSVAGRRYLLTPNTAEPFYIHGDGWLALWRVEQSSAQAVRLSFERRADAASPYAYRAEQSIRLDGPGLGLKLSVTNIGDTLPFGLGFHPFFPRTPGTTLLGSAKSWRTERDGHLPGEVEPIPIDVDFSTERPLPKRFLNNCFEGWSGAARIVWPETGMGVDIEADAALDRYMLYAPDADCSFFCFEPMSHTPNALAHCDADPRGLRLLAPGQSISVGFSITAFDWNTPHG
jgi:aldose 1-epimerase